MKQRGRPEPTALAGAVGNDAGLIPASVVLDAVFTQPIPNNPSLAGVHIYLQGALQDFGTEGTWALTDGLDATLH